MHFVFSKKSGSMEVELQSASPVVLTIFDKTDKLTPLIFEGVHKELEQNQMDIVDSGERLRNLNMTSSVFMCCFRFLNIEFT